MLFRSSTVMTAEDVQEAVTAKVMAGLTFQPVRNTQIIKIGFESLDPQMAERVPNTLADIYIASDLQANASIALGTSEVTPLELTTAYVPFANGGGAVNPYGILRVTDRRGEQLYTHEEGTLGQVVTPDEVAVMNRMMTQVLVRGTGKAANFGFPAAGKTGTTSDYRDASVAICGKVDGNL